MNKMFYDVSKIIYESNEPITPEEQARRKRMIKRMAALGVAAGIGVTSAELMLHPEARASILKSLKQKGLLKKLKGVGKQVWKPMAVGAGADLVIEPTNVKIAQAMEDRYKRKQKEKNATKQQIKA